jgi:hypothetical protein
MASAAASLKKSLPPTAAKKSPFKSAKKSKIPTPRQSRLSLKPSEVFCTEDKASSVMSEDSVSCAEEVEVVEDAVVDTTSSAVEVVVLDTVTEDLSVAERIVPEESAIIIEEVSALVSVSLPVTASGTRINTPKRAVKAKAAKSAVRVSTAQKVTVDVISCEVVESVLPMEVSEVQLNVSESVVKETVCAQEIVSVECVPAVEEVASVECAPAVEEVASVECAPAVEEVASVECAPAVEEVVSVECAPAVEEVVSVECVPAVEEVVSVECAPAVEEVVSVECAPAVEEVVSVECVPAVEIAVVDPTPARVTRSKISTPTAAVSVLLAVAAPRSSRRSCVTAAVTKSEKVIVEQTEATFPVSFENEAPVSEQEAEVSLPEASAVKGRGKRMSVASTKPAEAPSAMKRSRRGQVEVDTAVALVESSNSKDISDLTAIEIVAPIEEEPVSVVKPTPLRSSRKAQPPVTVPIEEIKSAPKAKGRLPRGVKQAIELEDEEEEEDEEALALLCDG